MGRRGPIGLDASQGGRTRSTGDSPPPPPGAPKCPDWLPDLARAKWGEILPELQTMGHVSPADTPVIAGYCVAYAELQEATATLEKDGRYHEGLRGFIAHPALAAQRSALKALREFGALLGLSPADRQRVKIPPRADAKPRVPVRDRSKGPPPPVEE